jgi:pyruvate,water dikinase
VQTGPDQIAPCRAFRAGGEYRRIEADLLERWDAPLVNDFLCMLAFGASRRLLQRWCGAAGLELHNSVMIGQGDIVSAEPAQRIARMGRLAAARPDVIAALRRAAASPDPAAGLAAAALPPPLAEELASYENAW